jgi:two-component system response regulator AtoC
MANGCRSWPARKRQGRPSDGTPLAEVERQLILATFEYCGENKERTAALLGISMKTLYNRLKEYRL